MQIPVLTEAVDFLEADIALEARLAAESASGNKRPADADSETLIAELQTQIAAGVFTMTDEIMRAAFAEMEAKLLEKISGRLRRELPEMIDRVLREHLREKSEY